MRAGIGYFLGPVYDSNALPRGTPCFLVAVKLLPWGLERLITP
jgi:hypothetical protein